MYWAFLQRRNRAINAVAGVLPDLDLSRQAVVDVLYFVVLCFCRCSVNNYCQHHRLGDYETDQFGFDKRVLEPLQRFQEALEDIEDDMIDE